MKLATVLLILLLTVSALAEDDVLRLYDIRDIAKSENRPASEIATQLEGHLKGITSVTVKEGVLAVKAPAVVHETVRNYLDALRRGKDDILRVFPIADLVTGGHRADVLALRVRKLAPKARVTVREHKHHGATLVIAAPAGELEKIDGFLEGLRAREMPIVSIEARVLRGGERVKDSGVRYLDEAGFATFIGEISKTEGVTVVGAPALSCYNGQRAKISVGKERNYVSDLEVSFAEDGSLLVEPVIGTFFEGFELTLRPVLSVDRKFVTLVVDTRMRRLLDPPPDSVSPAAKGTAVEIQLPELRETRRRNAVTLPVGHAVLLDLGTGPGEAESERLQILLRGAVIEMDEGK